MCISLRRSRVGRVAVRQRRRYLQLSVAIQAADIAFALQLIKNRELQKRLRNFENNVLAAFDRSHPSFAVAGRPTDRLEFDMDLKVRTVPTDERPLQW